MEIEKYKYKDDEKCPIFSHGYVYIGTFGCKFGCRFECTINSETNTIQCETLNKVLNNNQNITT